MSRQASQIVKAALFSALIVIGGASSIASAGGERGGGRGHHRHNDSCGHSYQPEYAGRIVIDGYSTSIRSDRPMNRQIVKAFRHAGYNARIRDGRILIEYGYCEPIVRWSRDRYNARFRWDRHYGELSISLNRYYSYNRHHRPRRRPVRVSRRSIGWGYCD